MLEQATTNTLKQRKYKKSQQRNRRYKEESNNFRNENTTERKVCWMNFQQNKDSKRKSPNLQIDDQKLSNLNTEFSLFRLGGVGKKHSLRDLCDNGQKFNIHMTKIPEIRQYHTDNYLKNND